MFYICKNFKVLAGSTYKKSVLFCYRKYLSMDLKRVIDVLEEFAPLNLAASWDNVGLLVEPSPPHLVQKILLTNDLTPKVIEEAIGKKISLIISYHPPIFQPLKRLTQSSWKESVITKCLEHRIAVYSPHTCWDVVKGGVNDWLISPFGNGANVKCLKANEEANKYKVEIMKHAKHASVHEDGSGSSSSGSSDAQNVLASIMNSYISYVCQADDKYVSLICDLEVASKIQLLTSNLKDLKFNCYELMSPIKFSKDAQGEGRLVTLSQPINIDQAVNTVKHHLGLKHVHLALGYKHANREHAISTIAACAGSGSSVLKGAQADLYLTGEMSHHELLDATNSRGGSTSVILCCHSNTERGFLSGYMVGFLRSTLGNGVEVLVAEFDKDPIDVV